jgi:hypothetical protein
MTIRFLFFVVGFDPNHGCPVTGEMNVITGKRKRQGHTHTHTQQSHASTTVGYMYHCIVVIGFNLDGVCLAISSTMEGRTRTLRYTTRVTGLLGPKDLGPLHYFALGPSQKVVGRACRQGHYKNKVPIQGGTITLLLPLGPQNMW